MTTTDYNNLINEGGEGFVPVNRSSEQQVLNYLNQQELTVEQILSGESLKAERKWFNESGFTAVAQANEACLKRGYALSELQRAIKQL